MAHMPIIFEVEGYCHDVLEVQAHRERHECLAHDHFPFHVLLGFSFDFYSIAYYLIYLFNLKPTTPNLQPGL